MTTIPASHLDLLEQPTGVFATIDPQSRPQLTVMGFMLDDDGVVKLSFPSTRAKTKNLRARPQCSLLIRDPLDGYRYLELRADATLRPDDDYVFADEIARRRYGGVDLRQIDGPGATRVVAELDLVRVNAVQVR